MFSVPLACLPHSHSYLSTRVFTVSSPHFSIEFSPSNSLSFYDLISRVRHTLIHQRDRRRTFVFVQFTRALCMYNQDVRIILPLVIIIDSSAAYTYMPCFVWATLGAALLPDRRPAITFN